MHDLDTDIDAEPLLNAQGSTVLTGHEDGMVRAWTCDGSTGWKETDSARWKVQVYIMLSAQQLPCLSKACCAS